MKIKKILITFFISIMIPISVLAYSSEVYLGGDNIGIEVKTKGILVVGLYDINNDYIASSSGISTGDYILEINGKKINNIDEFTNEIDSNRGENVDIKYKRNNKIYSSKLKVVNQDGINKTGLYLKDEVSGIGTLTLIDPENNRFLALGHAVLDSSTNNILEIDDGSIYSSYITGINKSSGGVPGEKVGESDSNNKYGVVNKNTNKGIFGEYQIDFNNKNKIKVGNVDEIKLGKATIYTVVDGNNIEEYEINIDSIDKNSDLKNILFTITDKELLEKTGGIVQGMSGSPIVQNDKIIGAITHVIVDDCKRGYGIFITNMLEESEKN